MGCLILFRPGRTTVTARRTSIPRAAPARRTGCSGVRLQEMMIDPGRSAHPRDRRATKDAKRLDPRGPRPPS